MGEKLGYFGRNNKRNDTILILRIEKLLGSENYQEDKMTEKIFGYINRYHRIFSLTDKMRWEIKKHLEIHKNEMEE